MNKVKAHTTLEDEENLTQGSFFGAHFTSVQLGAPFLFTMHLSPVLTMHTHKHAAHKTCTLAHFTDFNNNKSSLPRGFDVDEDIQVRSTAWGEKYYGDFFDLLLLKLPPSS